MSTIKRLNLFSTKQVDLNLEIDSLRHVWGRHTNHALLREMRFGAAKQINYGA
jgi:hypothetical protein